MMNRAVIRTSALATLLALPVLAADAAPGVKLPPYEEILLPNGARILLMEKHDVPMVAFRALIRGGAVGDPAGKEGLAALTAELLERGAGSRDAAAFAEAVDRVGGEISTTATPEAIAISGNFMSRDADLMISLLADMLRRPTLPASEFEKTRARKIEEIIAAKDSDPRALMDLYFHGFLFQGHPYSSPLDGTEGSLAAIDHSDVRAFHEAAFGGDRLILAVTGDFQKPAMRAKLRSAFGDWRKAGKPLSAVSKLTPRTGRRVLLVDKPGATQTYFMIGNVGVSRTDEDRVAIDLVNTVFGGRFTSMLNDALRVKSGLTYGARSALFRPSQPGSVAISTYTKTATTAQAVDMALDLLGQLHEKGIDETMLSSAKAYVLGQFPPALETNGQLAARLAEIALYGLDRSDVDRYGAGIAAASAADLRKTIARAYPSSENLTFVFVGDAAQIRDVVARYGEVTEMEITDVGFAPE